MNAVPASFGAHVVHAVAHAGRDALDDLRGLRDSQAKHIDQRIARIARFEHDLAAHRGYADAVAIASDAGHDALKQTRCSWGVELAESKGIQKRDRARTHRKD